jgi:very-short-patch-repair endonuclease
MTPAEALLWDRLKDAKAIGANLRRQHPLLFFVADFYCHKARLVIEVDGGVHDQAEQHSYDEGRSHELEAIGVTVIRFTNEQVLNNADGVVAVIRQKVAELITDNPGP